MKNKLKMLGYTIFEHTDMVSIAISKPKVRLIIIKNDEVYLDTNDLSSEPENIRSIHIRAISTVLVIRVVYIEKNSDNKEKCFTINYRIDSSANIVKDCGVQGSSIMEDDKHWMAVNGNNIYVHNKKTLKKYKYEFNGTDRKNLKYYCSTNKHCVLLDTTFVDTETSEVVCFDSISQCGQYLLCGYRLTGIANFSVENVQGIIKISDGNLYVVNECYKEDKNIFVVERNGEKETLTLDIKENKSRTAFVQTSSETIVASRN